MVNTKKLEEKIEKSGYKKQAIADALKISLQSLSNKINNITEFKLSEYQKLEVMLGLSSIEARQIFFALNVECESTRVAANG